MKQDPLQHLSCLEHPFYNLGFRLFDYYVSST